MKLYGVLFVWLAAVLGCLAMRKISPGTKWYPAYAFGVCACHYRDCWYLRSLTAMVVRSWLLLAPVPEKRESSSERISFLMSSGA